MENYSYKTRGVCARAIDIEIEGDTLTRVQFHGGCSGNTQGVASLVAGMKVEEVIDRLSGIRCGFKDTSCPDQLATALREYLAQN